MGDVVVRLMPSVDTRNDDGLEPEAFKSLDEYKIWRDRGRAGTA